MLVKSVKEKSLNLIVLLASFIGVILVRKFLKKRKENL